MNFELWLSLNATIFYLIYHCISWYLFRVFRFFSIRLSIWILVSFFLSGVKSYRILNTDKSLLPQIKAKEKEKNSHQCWYSNWFWPFSLSMLSSKYCVSIVFIFIIFTLFHGFTIPRIIRNLNNNDADLFHSFIRKFDYNRNDLKTSAEHKHLGIRQASHHYLTEQMMSRRF